MKEKCYFKDILLNRRQLYELITSVREVTSAESINVSRPERSGFYIL
jgi:hypothetical protein